MDPIFVAKTPTWFRNRLSGVKLPAHCLRSTWILVHGKWEKIEHRAPPVQQQTRFDRWVERACFQYHAPTSAPVVSADVCAVRRTSVPYAPLRGGPVRILDEPTRNLRLARNVYLNKRHGSRRCLSPCIKGPTHYSCDQCADAPCSWGRGMGGPPTTSKSSVPNIKRHQQPLQVKLRINGSGYRRLPEPTIAPEELCLYQVIVKIVQVIIV